MICQRNPAYINEDPFFEYVSNLFVPYVTILCEKLEFVNETGVLLMDSALTCVSERVLHLLGQKNILAAVFPAHTTNIFQALDLIFSTALKKLKQNATGDFDDNSINNQITKLVQAYEQIAISMTIPSSFRRTELYPEIRIQ